jgi:hypothetical protein
MPFMRQKILNTAELRSWKTTPSLLSVIDYLIYSKLRSNDQIKERGFGGYVTRMGRISYFNRALVTEPKEQGHDRTFLQPHFINGGAFNTNVLRLIDGGSSRKC